MAKKTTTELTPEIKEAVLLLRYRKKKPKKTDATYMSLGQIGTELGLTYRQVKYICERSDLHKKRKSPRDKPERIIEAEQEAYLKDPAILKAWAGRSLIERAVLYHRRFPHKVISAMELCRFYKRNQIKRKAVTRYKTATPEKQAEYEAWQRESYSKLQQAWNNNERVLYLDECVFTKATIPKLDYAHKHTNQTVNEQDFFHRYLAVVAAISSDRGVDCIMVFDEAITRETFITFLEELRRRNGINRQVARRSTHKHHPTPINVYLDNLAVHKCPEVKEAYDRLNIQPIFNVPYAF